jgi:hypothetical protein
MLPSAQSHSGQAGLNNFHSFLFSFSFISPFILGVIQQKDYINKILNTLQYLTGKYREIQGNPCNENRDPAMKTGFPCNESRFFPVGIDLQGFPVSCTGFGFTVHS